MNNRGLAPPDRPLLSVILRILSGVFAAAMFISAKAVSDDVPLGEIVFFRAFFAVIPLLVFLWVRQEFPHGLATKRPFGHFLRCGFGVTSLFAYFGSLSWLNVSEAALIAQLGPVLMAGAAGLLLSERLTRWRVGGLVLGFAGVIVLIWPELNSEAGGNSGLDSVLSARLIGYILGFIGALSSALALIMLGMAVLLWFWKDLALYIPYELAR